MPADRVATPPPSLVSQETGVAYARWLLDTVPETDFPLTSTVLLPGLEVTVRHGGGALADAVGQQFVQARPEAGPAGSMEVFLAHPGIPGVPRPAIWNGPYLPHLVAEAFAAAGLDGAFFHDLDHWHLYDRSRHRAVQLMRAPDDFPPWEAGAPLRVFLHWYYAGRGLRLAHCGTLGIGGRGVLLPGAGGSGKSGTVIGGLLHGLQSVGDDYVLLSTQGEIVARPIYATLKQDPAGYARLGLSKVLPSASALNWQGKHQFRLGDVARAPAPDALLATALLVPRVAHAARSRIRPMPRREAMMALAASSIHQMPGERESGFRFFSEIAQRLPCFSLELGLDPAEVSDTVADFIEGRVT